MSVTSCRACGEETLPIFSGIILKNIPVTYHQCPACETLQLSDPHWLSKAYTLNHYPDPDTGRLMRAQVIHRVIRRLRALRLLPKCTTSLDEGAGLGLLVRLLRDNGCEAWGHDPYATPVFAEPYILPTWPEGNFHLITATEVIEHTIETADFLKDLGDRLSPKGILLITTELHDPARLPDPSNWPYLAQDFGQHITFLSANGLRALVKRAGLHWWASLEFAGCQCIHLISRTPPSRWKQYRLNRRHAKGEARFSKDESI